MVDVDKALTALRFFVHRAQHPTNRKIAFLGCTMHAVEPFQNARFQDPNRQFFVAAAMRLSQHLVDLQMHEEFTQTDETGTLTEREREGEKDGEKREIERERERERDRPFEGQLHGSGL